VLKGFVSGQRQLEREVEALKLLSHPNIVTALGVCRHQTPMETILYLELECVQQQKSLHAHVHAHGHGSWSACR